MANYRIIRNLLSSQANGCFSNKYYSRKWGSFDTLFVIEKGRENKNKSLLECVATLREKLANKKRLNPAIKQFEASCNL